METAKMRDNIERRNVEVAESVLASVIALLQANAILRHFHHRPRRPA